MDQKKTPATPMLVKFKTDYSGKTIERVEVIRETAASVYVAKNSVFGNAKGERRDAKRSEYAQYHDTWADAHAYLMERAEERVTDARNRLQQASGHLGNIKGMKQPEELA
jgi:hypothetical protein